MLQISTCVSPGVGSHGWPFGPAGVKVRVRLRIPWPHSSEQSVQVLQGCHSQSVSGTVRFELLID